MSALSPPSEHPSDRPVSAVSVRGVRAWRRLAQPLGLVLIGGLAGTLALGLGGPVAAAGALVVSLALVAAWVLRQPATATDPADGDVQDDGTRDARLSAQVLPVWQRNVEAARQHSERSSSNLLEAFANVSGHLDQAMGNGAGDGQLDVGAADQLLDRHAGELQQLLAATQDAVRLKNEMQQRLADTARQLDGMSQLAREVMNIGRATHLLALNASVEATRAGSAGEGFAVVAREVRTLASESRQAGTQLTRTLNHLREQLDDLQRQARRLDTDDDEINRRTQQAARAVVLALIGSLAEISRASRDLRLAGREVQNDLEKIFVSLQSQDRLSQMLSSVTTDIERYVAWLHGTHDPAAAVPQAWLERLESSYTMEELRSAHHGTTVVEQETSVQFF